MVVSLTLRVRKTCFTISSLVKGFSDFSSTEVMISEIPDMISVIKDNEQDFADFTIDGQFLTKEEWNIILNGLTVSVEFIRQQRKPMGFIREPRRFERCDY